MKFLVFTFAVFLILMNQVSAHTEPGINPKLRFDESIVPVIVDSHLNVIEEEIIFPQHSQKTKFEKALSLIEEIMNSEEFKTKVLTYINKKGKRQFAKNFIWNDSNRLLSNEEIYNHIMKGDERMRINTVGEMNLNTMIKACNWSQKASPWCRTVVGSTSPYTSKWIELNWKFYSNFETHQMVGNIVHEWLHLIGFIHGKENLEEEVPYVVGAIASDIAKEILNR